jgi:hypothetical protein
MTDFATQNEHHVTEDFHISVLFKCCPLHQHPINFFTGNKHSILENSKVTGMQGLIVLYDSVISGTMGFLILKVRSA